MTALLRVPPHARAAWERLHDVLETEPAPAPCVGPDRDDWTGTAAQQRTAADRCLDCAAMPACAAYALTAREPHGAWGGLTPTDRTPKPKKTTKRKKATRR